MNQIQQVNYQIKFQTVIKLVRFLATCSLATLVHMTHMTLNKKESASTLKKKNQLLTWS